MAVALTRNGITMITEGVAAEELQPVLQVVDIKQLTTQKENASERYRVLLSDGEHAQQGMLGTQMNPLVHSGRLQKGSVIRLMSFVSQVIQNRKIIIIIDVEVLMEQCEIIGEPKQVSAANGTAAQARSSMPVHSSGDQSGVITMNPQSHGGGSFSGSVPGESTIGRALLQHPKLETGSITQSYGSNPDSRGYASTNGAPAFPRSEPPSRFQSSTHFSGGYNDQNRSFQNSKPDAGSLASSNNYGRPPQSTYQQQPINFSNRGPTAKNEAPAKVLPISALNPYCSKWTIKARVTSKTELRQYRNMRGEGKVFSFDLLDSLGGEIQVTCFNAVADQFYDQIVTGRLYLISKGTVKPVTKAFGRVINDNVIYLDSCSVVLPCMEDDGSIPKQQFQFSSITDIESKGSNAIVDVIGIVSSINLTATITKKDGTETLKRTLQLKDMSGRSVELTLWGNFCNAEGQQLQNLCDSGVFPVLAVKGGRVNEFNGKSVGTVNSSQLYIEPDYQEARDLKEWFNIEGKNVAAVSISRQSVGGFGIRKTVSQIKDEQLGTSDQPDWITVKGSISYIKVDNFYYPACPLVSMDRQCSKKLTNTGDGRWHCDKCNESVAECDYRYLLQVQVQDHTGITWATAFQESGQDIMGIPAKDLVYMKEEGDDEKFTLAIRRVLFTQYVFKLKVKEESYLDEKRVKSTVVKAEKVDVKSEAMFLLDLMDKPAVEPKTIPGNNIGYRNVESTQGVLGSSAYSGRDMGRANQAGQHVNQYNTLDTGVSVLCTNCGGRGHNADHCPSNNSRQGQSMAGGYVNRPSGAAVSGKNFEPCYKCNQVGHWSSNCPERNNASVHGSGGGVNSRYGGASNQRATYQ